MERQSFSIEKIKDVDRYLKEGAQTRFTPEIEKIAQQIEGDYLQVIDQIFACIKILKEPKKGFDRNLFRKRTADQIIKDGFITGCSDAGLVYITLARAKNIPSKYIETINLDWLNQPSSSYKGHIYSQSYNREKSEWEWIDPMKTLRNISFNESNRVIYKEGLDSWDIGIQDFDSMADAFDEFRARWISTREPEEKRP